LIFKASEASLAATVAAFSSLVTFSTTSCLAVKYALSDDATASSSSAACFISPSSSDEQLGVGSSNNAFAYNEPDVILSSVLRRKAALISAVILINSAHVSGLVIFSDDLFFLALLVLDMPERRTLTFAVSFDASSTAAASASACSSSASFSATISLASVSASSAASTSCCKSSTSPDNVSTSP